MKKEDRDKPFRLSLSFSMSLLPLLGKSSFLGRGHLPLLAGNRSAIAAGHIRPLTASMLRTSSVMHLPAEISLSAVLSGAPLFPGGLLLRLLAEVLLPLLGSNEALRRIADEIGAACLLQCLYDKPPQLRPLPLEQRPLKGLFMGFSPYILCLPVRHFLQLILE